MYLNEESNKEYELLYKVKKINDFNKYLDNLVDRFNKLDRRGKKKLIKNINMAMSFHHMYYIHFLDNEPYYIYNSASGLRYILSSQLFRINKIEDFDNIIEEIKEYSINLVEKFNTERITKTQVDDIFNTLYKLYPNLKNIFSNVTINIFLFNFSNKVYNSHTMPAISCNFFTIMCYYIKDDEEFKKYNNNPIYVFLHELGHVLLIIITKNFIKVPDKFLESAGLKYVLKPNQLEASEVFADFFAFTVMHQTEYNKYNVFDGKIPDTLYLNLDNYFKKLIDNYQVEDSSIDSNF